MNRGLVLSGLGHLGLILWVFLGDWFFMPAEPPLVQVASVSIVSAAQFDAMVAPAPKKPARPVRRPKRDPKRRPPTKSRAARIGPTVCELEGPMPILNRSKTETAMEESRTR